MADSTTLTIRISQATKDKLDAIATSTKRSKSFLAAEAIEEYLAVQARQIEHIEKGIAELDRGNHVAHEDVRAWAGSLGTGSQLPLPTVRKR